MALALRASNDSAEFPPPRDLTELQRDERWLFRIDVDLSTSVVVLIPLQRQLCLTRDERPMSVGVISLAMEGGL
jgi:hypothetical protein